MDHKHLKVVTKIISYRKEMLLTTTSSFNCPNGTCILPIALSNPMRVAHRFTKLA